MLACVRPLRALLLAAFATQASAAIPVPSVAGPIPSPDMPGAPTHNYPFFASNHQLAVAGYVENEYLFAGNANQYTVPTVPAGSPGATATVMTTGNPYVSRMIVRRPADPAKFNGTVLVEWLNVTNGFDADNFWFFTWEHILKKGYAWVGVSAQNVGATALKAWSSRYANLNVTVGGTITGDALSYDIFSQAGQAIRTPNGGVDVLGGLKMQHLIAVGESQSASYLSTYVNSINPVGNEYDGFLLLSTPGNVIRTDLTQPVWKVLTEWDVQADEAPVRQPDTSMFHLWEIAGAAHVDKQASREPIELRDNGTSSEAALNPTCQIPDIGSSVPTHYVVSTAIDLMVNWIANGVAPPAAPRIQLTQVGTLTSRASAVARTNLGIAIGGIQLSQAAVPTQESSGVNVGPGACNRWGFSLPLPKSELDELYPSYQSYVDEIASASLNNVAQGYIEQGDLEQTVLQAITSDVGNPMSAQRQRNLAAFFGEASAGLDYGLQ